MADPKLHQPGDSPSDWTEDFPHENGCYINRCISCGLIFYGYKRRSVCKTCADAVAASPAAPQAKPTVTHLMRLAVAMRHAPPDGYDDAYKCLQNALYTALPAAPQQPTERALLEQALAALHWYSTEGGYGESETERALRAHLGAKP